MPAPKNLGNKIKDFWPKSGPDFQEIERYIKKYSREKPTIINGRKQIL